MVPSHLGSRRHFERLSSQSTLKMENLNLVNAIASSHDVIVTASSSLDVCRFSVPHIPSIAQNINEPSTSNCHFSGQMCMSLNQHPVTMQSVTTDCDFKPQILMTDSTEISSHHKCMNNLQNNYYGNQNLKYTSSNSTPDSFKTSFHRLNGSPLLSSHTDNENMISRQDLFPSFSPDVVLKLPKTISFCTDYEMSCNNPLAAISDNASTIPIASQGLNILRDMALVQSVSSEHMMMSSTGNTTGVQETAVHQCLTRTAAPVSTRSQHSPFISSPNQPSLQVDVTNNQTFSTSSTLGGTSVNDCPSPQVSDLGSEDTHVSMSQQSFAQTYASLTPWTTKLAAPGYIPLAKPAADAMPIPLEDASNEYFLSMSSFSHKMHAQSYYARPYQGYRRLKPGMTFEHYNNVLPNSKTKNGLSSGPLHAQRPNYKMLPNKEHRFRRTADALKKSGLWEVAMKTGSLIKQNRELQKELEEFRSDAIAFLKSVIKDPHNRDFIKSVLNTALTSNTSSCTGSSVMTVVVSAAAASGRLDYDGSSDGSMSGNSST